MQSCQKNLIFDWTKPLDNLPQDRMDRSKHAEFLTTFLINKSKSGNYVLNLNAGWGTGKSYFLRRWIDTIKNHYPTVYIDSWKNDHSKDPLLNVVAEIKTSLISKTEVRAIDSSLLKGTWRLIKSVAPDATKAIIKNKLGINTDELGEILDKDSLADIGAKLVGEAIKAHEETVSSIENFKKAVLSWLDAVIDTAEPKLHYPLFIFIDELDRCRPTFAIEMLETVKHIFDMDKVVFVIATDKTQLEHSIKAVYGQNFNSQVYLDRFFNRTVILNNVPPQEFIKSKVDLSEPIREFCKYEHNFPFRSTHESRLNELIYVLTGISNGFDMSLRSIDLWIDKLEAAILSTKTIPDIFIISFLTALETQCPDHMKKLSDGSNIFEVASIPNDEKKDSIKFKDFTINFLFSFEDIAGRIRSDLWDIYPQIFRNIFPVGVGFLGYIEHAIFLAGKINIVEPSVFEGMAVEEYRQVLTKKQLTKDNDKPIGSMYSIPRIISCALFLRHNDIKFSTKNYLDLCRMATYFD
ncbi:P-loop NTPase fold protein [Kosakonia sacchari]